MPHKLTSFPQFDAFSSQNQGEAQRYALARQAFLEQFVQEPKIQTIFACWDKTTKLHKLAVAVAVASDRLAKALGLANRGQLSLNNMTIDPQDRRMVKFNAVREKAIAQFKKQLSAIPKALYQDAVRVAQELGCPWLWMIRALVHAFILRCSAVAVGLPFSLSQTVEPDKITLEVTSSTSKRELLATYRAARLSHPRGRVPKKNTEAINSYVRWWCRHKVGHVPIRQLAQDDHVERSLVQYGIRRANNLFKLTAYTPVSSSPLQN